MALIPEQNADIIIDAEEIVEPLLTWRVNVDHDDGINGNISGEVDNEEAVKQAIYLLLNIERDKFTIYKDSGYGVEMEDLIGMPIPYVIPEYDRRVTKAILHWIPEVTEVSGFAFSIPEDRSGVLATKFKVYTPFGELDIENSVAI